MLTFLVYLGEDPSNCPDDCPCECSQIGTTKSNTATTNAGSLQYNSGTQSHSVLMFALHAYSFPSMTELKAELTVGNNSPIDVYFGPVSQEVLDGSGWVIFGIQIDASAMSSGVYNWELDFEFYYETSMWPTSYSSNYTSSSYRPLQIANRDESSYGVGWSMSYDTRLAIQVGLPGQPDGVALVSGNNDITWYHDPTPEGIYTREENSTNFSELKKLANSTYELTDPNGTKSIFNSQGLLQTVVDRNGNALATYTYGEGDDEDKIIGIVDQSGRHTHFEYDAGLLVSVTDFYDTAGAQTTEYEYYSGTDQLHRMIEPDPDGTYPLTSPTTTYHYNSLGLLDSVIDPRGLESLVTYDQNSRVESITERCGGVTNITSMQSLVTVDLATNGPSALAQLNPWLLESAGVSEAEEAFAGNTYETRIAFGEVTKVIRDRFGSINFTQDAYGTVTKYDRDSANGLLSRVIQNIPSNPWEILDTYYDYDDAGRLTHISKPIGFQTWSYGAFGQLEHFFDNAHETYYDLDPLNGNAITMWQRHGNNWLETTYTYTDALDNTLLGLVETITDPNGNVTYYQYTSSGLVESITYAEGTADEVTVQYEYDNRDRLSAMIDGRGARTKYVYDNLDRLISRVDPDPDTGLITSASPVWEYRYDRVGNQTQVIDPLGNVTEYVYDTRGRLFQEIAPLPSGTPSVATKDDSQYKAVTGTWSTSYETEAYSSTIRTSSTTGAVATYSFTGLDSTKQYAVQVRWVPSSNPDEYDKNALWQVYAGNGTGGAVLNSLRTDLNSQPEGMPDGSDMMWLSLGAFKPGSGGQAGPSLTIKLSDDDNNGELVIDAVRLVEVGLVTQTEYDCNGNLVKVIDPLGHVTQYMYDDLDRLVARKDPDPTTGGITANSPLTSYAYNSLGWLTSMTDPNENVTVYEHDKMGRRIKEARVVGSGLSGEFRDYYGELLHTDIDADLNFAPSTNFAGYSDLSDGFKAEWNGALLVDATDDIRFYLNNTDYAALYIDGQLVYLNYGYSNMTEAYVDVDLAAGWHTFTVKFQDLSAGQSGLVVSYDVGNGKEVIPNGALFTMQTTTTSYDAVGRVTAVTDPNGNTTTYSYDTLDRLTSESIVIDSLTQTRNYQYFTGDNIVKKTDRNGRVTEYEYDHLNRLIAEVWYDDVTPIRTISYGYDENSNLLSVTDPTATYGYEYDYLNRRLESAQNITGLSPGVDFAYAYDDASRMTSVGAAIGSTNDFLNTFAYDHLGRLTGLTQAGQSTGHDVTSKNFELQYNAASQLTSVDGLINEVDYFTNSTYTYDKAGRLTQLSHSAYSYVTEASFEETHSYTYDKRNRVTSYSNVYGGIDVDYDYDPTDQLTEADYTTLSDEEYIYDANGNRIGSSVEIGAYNRLLSDGTYRYEYDGEGNRTRRYVDADQSGTFNAGDTDVTEQTWDYRNRLVTVKDYATHGGSVTQQVDYSYDAFNQMVKRVVDPDGATGSATLRQSLYIHDQGQVVLQFDKGGTGSVATENLSHRYLWNPQVVDRLFTDEYVDLIYHEGDETLWALTDRQGSITDLVDSNATLRQHRAFDSFGNIIDETCYDAEGEEISSSAYHLDQAFAYTGRFFDKLTGLQNNLNRWYDANTGRWLSEDPIGFAAGDANLYRYVGNGPVNGTDPSGLAWWNPYDSSANGPYELIWGCTEPAPPATPGINVHPIITTPIGTALGPPGVTEAVGGLECVPDILRIWDTTDKKTPVMDDPMDDDAFDEYEKTKQKHRPRFDPK
jgi:RHS repeat-associated protein